MTADDEITPSTSADPEGSAESAEDARKGGLPIGAIVAIAAAGVVVLAIAGLGIYDIVHDDPPAPTASRDDIFRAAAPECEQIGYENENRAFTCKAAFLLGAEYAWDEDEQRWLASDERDEGFDTMTSLVTERPQRFGLTAEQVANEEPWLTGFYSGAIWMKDEAGG